MPGSAIEDRCSISSQSGVAVGQFKQRVWSRRASHLFTDRYALTAKRQAAGCALTCRRSKASRFVTRLRRLAIHSADTLHEDPNASVQDGVSETMLWTLYDRACEARRPDGILKDPDSVRICNAIDYDFVRRFGEPVGSFAARAARIDQLLTRWLERHPDGLVVSLGEGLETQAHRVDNGQMQWITVDLPAAIRTASTLSSFDQTLSSRRSERGRAGLDRKDRTEPGCIHRCSGPLHVSGA